MTAKARSGYFPYILLAMLLAIAAYVAYNSYKPTGGLSVLGDAPEFSLNNANGQPFDSKSLDGSVRLMEFMFTSCPDICPATTYNMVRIQNELKKKGLFGSEVKMVAITFDPERDTPEALRKYAERMNMDMSGWTVLRGDEAKTHSIAKQYGVTVQNLGDGQFVHTVTSLILIDSTQRIRNVYRMGSDMDNSKIIQDIEALVNERS